MGIVAVGTIVNLTVALPIHEPFTMRAEVPVFVAIRVAASTNEMRFVYADRFIEKGDQIGRVLQLMTRMAPEATFTMIEFGVVKRVKLPDFGIRLHGRVAFIAGIEKKLVDPGHDLNLRRALISFEAQCAPGFGCVLRISRQSGQCADYSDPAESMCNAHGRV